MGNISTETTQIALALGSNIGDRLAALHAAREKLAPHLTITKTSPIYETAAEYVTDQPTFFNAALIGETKLAPLELLQAIKKLETELGRQPTVQYGPRIIDIDILFYGDTVMATPELTLPHPRIAEREFVLRPLADIAPNWIDPQTDMTIAAMLKRLPKTTATRTPHML